VTTTAPHRTDAALSVDEIDVTASDRVEDIDEALMVVHEGFVEAGYLAPKPSGRRMHAAYLNPGTIFFVARIDGETVGTCALIADGPFGLPSDRAFAEENDALREATRGTIYEAGSLAVRSEYRRSTRRIVMRLFAAMTRVALVEFPEAPVPLAVTPENRRFYAAMAGTIELAGPRPLYGAPAVLLQTGATALAAHCALRTTPTQRAMDGLLTEMSPSWFTDRRSHLPLPSGWLNTLLDEQGVTDQLAAQLRLLAETYPDVLSRILAAARSRAAA